MGFLYPDQPARKLKQKMYKAELGRKQESDSGSPTPSLQCLCADNLLLHRTSVKKKILIIPNEEKPEQKVSSHSSPLRHGEKTKASKFVNNRVFLLDKTIIWTQIVAGCRQANVQQDVSAPVSQCSFKEIQALTLGLNQAGIHLVGITVRERYEQNGG